MLASLLSLAARAYGALTPYHHGKGRLVEAVTERKAVRARDRGREVVVRRQGVVWSLSLDCYVQRSLYYLGLFEAWETRALLGYVTPGSTFADVGANFGYYSMLAAKAVGPSGRVHAFEPTPGLAKRLRHTAERNGFTHLTLHQVAVSDHSGAAAFAVARPDNQGTGHLVGTASADTITVTLTTLDEVATDWPRLDVMKLDVEGAEPAALRGAEATIRRFRPVILAEVNEHSLLQSASSAAALVAQFRGLGYDLLRPTAHGLVPLTHPSELGSPPHGNVIALPR
jgi:FkbM family methyltransferase